MQTSGLDINSRAVTGLFFGSFNPVHMGHLIIAQHMIDYGGCEEVWFVVSPQNPFKTGDDLLSEEKRMEMVQLAIDGNAKFKASDVELYMEAPSYTVRTLDTLRQAWPEKSFALIMGADNLSMFHLWREYDRIIRDYEILVYPRPGYPSDGAISHSHIRHVNAPLIEISSSMIRDMIATAKSPRYLLPGAVYQKICAEAYYAIS